jgi:hypothetical protein
VPTGSVLCGCFGAMGVALSVLGPEWLSSNPWYSTDTATPITGATRARRQPSHGLPRRPGTRRDRAPGMAPPARPHPDIAPSQGQSASPPSSGGSMPAPGGVNRQTTSNQRLHNRRRGQQGRIGHQTVQRRRTPHAPPDDPQRVRRSELLPAARYHSTWMGGFAPYPTLTTGDADSAARRARRIAVIGQRKTPRKQGQLARL